MQNAHDLRSLVRDAIEDNVRPHRYAAHASDNIIALAKLRTAIRDVCYCHVALGDVVVATKVYGYESTPALVLVGADYRDLIFRERLDTNG
jgi:hypothetical protein